MSSIKKDDTNKVSHSILDLTKEEYKKLREILNSQGRKVSFFFTHAARDYISGKYKPW